MWSLLKASLSLSSFEVSISLTTAYIKFVLLLTLSWNSGCHTLSQLRGLVFNNIIFRDTYHLATDSSHTYAVASFSEGFCVSKSMASHVMAISFGVHLQRILMMVYVCNHV
jgi:hypothetical protein